MPVTCDTTDIRVREKYCGIGYAHRSITAEFRYNAAVPPILFERRVRFDHEDLDAVPMMIRAETSDLTPGTRLEVEVGARWTDSNGVRERVGGQWIPCTVVIEQPRELVVRLAG